MENNMQVDSPRAYVCADSKIYDATEWYICQVYFFSSSIKFYRMFSEGIIIFNV